MQRWRWRGNWTQLHTWYENKIFQRTNEPVCVCVVTRSIYMAPNHKKKNKQRENQIKSIIKSVLGLILLMCLQTLLVAIAHLPLYSHTLAQPQIASTTSFISVWTTVCADAVAHVKQLKNLLFSIHSVDVFFYFRFLLRISRVQFFFVSFARCLDLIFRHLALIFYFA